MSATPSEVQVWTMALEFLAEAERVPSTAVPRMATHAAYYAMFHGARTVLLRLEGLSAPTKHNVVVSRFGYHAKQANDAILMAAARTEHGAARAPAVRLRRRVIAASPRSCCCGCGSTCFSSCLCPGPWICLPLSV